MNKQKWLVAGLSVAMLASLSLGLTACSIGKKPDTPPEHTHTYDAWDHDETQHWKYCDEHGTDKSNIDESTKANHDFSNGNCVCGMEKPEEGDVTPDEGRDTRVFYVVGSGAGDLKNCSFTELKPGFMLTKQPKKDENGYTVYTTSILTLYAGDTMKIVQDLDWDDGLGYFGVGDIKNNDGSLVDGGGPGNITLAVGKDGKYRFTVRTKPDIAFSECTLEFELVEPVEPLKNAEEIYIVGNLAHYKTQWPSGGSAAGCLKLNHDETTGEWSITLRLGRAPGETGGDEFKLYNSVNGAYIPEGVNNNKQYGANNAGDYKISWKTGETDITFTKLEHTHVFDRQTKDDTQHWNICWLDDTADEQSREGHVYTDDQDSKCDTCGYTRHIHSFTKQNKDETQHWMECPADGTISPEGKQDHVYDQEDGTCICGAVQADDCAHDGKIIFDYTADIVPEGNAEGGTIMGKCEKCGNPVGVSYDKYVEYNAVWAASASLSRGSIFVVENNKTYYGKRTNTDTGSLMYIGYKVEAVGTLTISADIVFNNADTKPFDYLYMETLMPSSTAFDAETPLYKTERLGAVVWKGKYSTNNNNKALVEKWREQIVFDEPLRTDKVMARLNSMTITFTEEDIGTYLYMSIVTNVPADHTNAATLLYVRFTPTAAETISAPAEVAMLPDRKD